MPSALRSASWLALLLPVGLLAADNLVDMAPFRHEGPGSGRRPAGFAEARVRAPTLGRVEDSRGGDFHLRLVPGGTRVELVYPDLDGDQELRALLPDGRTAWLPPACLELLEKASTLTRRELLDEAGQQVVEPRRDLPRGVTYRRMVRRGARLHLVTVDLVANPDLEFLPYATARYDQTHQGEERVAGVDELARRSRALLALNGPFFIPTGRHRGQPLGSLVADGKVLFDLEDPRVLARNRTYLAWTNAGRFVMGETDLPASRILELNRQGAFDARSFAQGERIRALVGGLGRLAREGDPEAWRLHAGSQFGASYYGRQSRRPQSIVGLAEGGSRLYVLVQEGFPHSERCFTLPELSQLLSGMGAEDVAFNDGGGSAELVLEGTPVVRTEHAGPHRQNSTVLVVREKRRPVLDEGTYALYPESK